MWCHLGGSHRPTIDIDTAARAGDRAAALLDIGRSGSSRFTRVIGDIVLEVIAVEAHGDASQVDEVKDRLFLTAHSVAAADPVDALVHLGADATMVPVAPLGALIGCKLHAGLDRRDQAKRESDGVDILALLGHADPDDLLDGLRRHPSLIEPVRWAADEVLVRQAHRVGRLIMVDTQTPSLGDERTAALGRLLVGLCEEAA